MPVVAKICGLTSLAAAETAIRHGADYLGFIFHEPSARHVSWEQTEAIAAQLSQDIPRVAVLVNPDDAVIEAVISALRPAFLQLHGQESPERVEAVKIRFGLPIIKAIGVANAADIQSAIAYAGLVESVLFDTKTTGGESGGTGKTFDWGLLSRYAPALPWFLSGGLDAANLAAAIRITGATRVDASSRLESSPGVKDEAKVKMFLETVKAIP